MNVIVFHGVYLLVLLIQWALIPYFALAGIEPDLPLLYFVFWSWNQSRRKAVLAGFSSGVMADVAGGGLWGLHAAAGAVIGFAARSYGLNRYEIRRIMVFGFLAVLSLFYETILLLLMSWHDLPLMPALLLRYAVPRAIYTAFTGVLMQFLIEKAKKIRIRE